jgi:long-chain acyl-CoA synthetase
MTRPWQQHYDPGVPLALEPTAATIPSLLYEAAHTSPQGIALAFLGTRLTYSRLAQEAARLAQNWGRLGLAPGDRLAIFLPNCPQLVLAYQAAMRLGAVVVMLNPLLGPKEVEYQLLDSGARWLVALDHLLPKVDRVLDGVGLTRLIVTGIADYLPFPLNWLYPLKGRLQKLALGFRPGPGRHSWREMLKPGRPVELPPPPRPEDVALLQYTGGTTGVPKAAMLTHANLMANVDQINAWLPMVKYGRERLVGLLPFSHSFGLTACLNWPMSRAATIIVLPRFEMDGFLSALKKYRPTMLPGVPTLFVALINDPRLARLDLSDLWACISGSAPLPLEVRDRFEALTDCRILEGYGLTEAGPVTHLNPIHGDRPPASIGLPFPSTDVKVMDPETGARELPWGEVGELAIKGPQVMAGYWNNPGETAYALRDGWLYTGDLGRMDKNGYFYIIDRKKDLIINGGYKIFPREVEEILYQIPGVKEAVAVGEPDSYRGEAVKVVIVLKEGAHLTEAEVQDFCKERLAVYKVPKIVEFREELPKSLVGKVLRRALRPEPPTRPEGPQAS